MILFYNYTHNEYALKFIKTKLRLSYFVKQYYTVSQN